MARDGELEQRVLDVLWDEGEGTVRDVLAALGSDHAYTTILTVLDRLHAKGRAARRKRGQAWVYRAARSREQELAESLSGLVGTAGVPREQVLMAFLESVESVDEALLDRLETLIRERRRKRS